MNIAIVGTGAIGSTFAYQLAKAGHAVTVVARGDRLAQLQRDQAIVLSTGDRAAVRVGGALDAATPWDLVLVTVLAPQVDAVLPALQASAARTVMFMFNTFEPIDRLREAVGTSRFAFGFPAGVFSVLSEGKITPQLRSGTTVTDATWARAFTDAGIRTVVDDDMHSWLRSHAALVIPLMSISMVNVRRGRGITWGEARGYARAMAVAFGLVRELGNSVRPGFVAVVGRLPGAVTAFLLWVISRTQMSRDLGLLGPAEARMLIDQMTAAAPGRTGALLAIRP